MRYGPLKEQKKCEKVCVLSMCAKTNKAPGLEIRKFLKRRSDAFTIRNNDLRMVKKYKYANSEDLQPETKGLKITY